MKYKSLTLISILAIVAVGCNNPKSDAKEVCDCYQHVIDNPKEAENYGIQKCQALNAEKLLKYKNSPKQILEFNLYLDSCTKIIFAKAAKK
ncbi:hypothetical protein [Pedobacter borealis]|uniref:hypothetical protein n=1 Tax=Pedobacter borealis TaxID=475254 RepID=UPI000493512F|nr:hypothetical protein [Pedobacter borealis]